MRVLLGSLVVAFLVLSSPAGLGADATFTFVDVGQGDAIWVSDDTGFDLLVDGGARGMGGRVLDAIADRDDLDVIVWTHGHEDHIGGLIEVLNGKPAQRIVYNGFGYDSATFEGLMDVVTSLMIPTTVGRPGDTYAWGELTAVVVGPVRPYGNENDNSLVLRVSHGEVDVLLTGDAEASAEGAMLGSVLALDTEILKVGHHGSDTSSSDAFLDAVGPEVAVISVGVDNPYGHPAPETLGRLAARGIATYRTDRDGTVVVRSDGVRYSVNAPLPESEPVLFLPFVLRAPEAEPLPTLTTTPVAPAPTSTREPTATVTATLIRTATRTSTATFTPRPALPTATHTPAVTPLPTTSVTPYTAGLQMTKFEYDSPDEYVEITNQGVAEQVMTGWRLWSVTGDQMYHFPAGYTLGAGSRVRVHSGPDAMDSPPLDLRWTTRYIWNNEGDEARLLDANGSEVDRWGY